jgi:MoaA/NifB/PqqE/SkfB family radical SAM enzyme
MEKLQHKEYDFSSKLRQASVVKRLKEYIMWQRSAEDYDSRDPLPPFGPVSINLDLTSSCNFACPHCVDSTIINTGASLELSTVQETLDTLTERGLLSVILLGGGEPTLHRDFATIVRYIKRKGLQLGIVTNGSRLSQVAQIADLLEDEDWLRISLDAGSEETFIKSHKPKTAVTLQEILVNAQEIKKHNPRITLGYSFVIVWDGLYIGDQQLFKNIDEMPEAAQLAAHYSFDYISFKPCLIRLEDTHKESLLDTPDKDVESHIRATIENNLLKARNSAGDNLKVLTSVNLRALLKNELSSLKKQPQRCHMQYFSTVVTPSGIFHCPAFRGVEKAKIAECNGYAGSHHFEESKINLTRSLKTFDATEECKVVACFYHHVNWWVENFMDSNNSIDEIAEAEDDNFFL